MGALKMVALLVALLVATPAEAAGPADAWRGFVAEASRRFSIPENWIWRVMNLESRGRTMLGGRPIRSPKGAMGLMQLMPATWEEMRAAYALGPDPDDPRDNILAGAAYLRLMYERFGYPGLFAAYNAGPARYAAVLSGRASLPRETRDYLAGVTSRAGGEPARERENIGRADLIVIARETPGTVAAFPDRPAAAAPSSDLFAIVRAR